MDEKTTHLTDQPRDDEIHVLAHIVDALLAVQTDLQDATVEQWTRTLVDSCRRQKQSQPERHGPIAASC